MDFRFVYSEQDLSGFRNLTGLKLSRANSISQTILSVLNAPFDCFALRELRFGLLTPVFCYFTNDLALSTAAARPEISLPPAVA